MPSTVLTPTDYSPDPTLTPLQNQVINFLAQGCTITQAAERCGVHRNTVGNWRRTVPTFAAELEHANRERSIFWLEQATELAPQAILVISTILHNEAASPSIRLRAALAVMKMAADPTPAPLRPLSIAVARMEAVNGQLRSWQKQKQQNQSPTSPVVQPPNPAQKCTIQPIRRTPEPGRNSPCACGSGVKYKRCCGNPAKAHPVTLPLPGPDTIAASCAPPSSAFSR